MFIVDFVVSPQSKSFSVSNMDDAATVVKTSLAQFHVQVCSLTSRDTKSENFAICHLEFNAPAWNSSFITRARVEYEMIN